MADGHARAADRAGRVGGEGEGEGKAQGNEDVSAEFDGWEVTASEKEERR